MKIETLLHRQGGKCFYCRKTLDRKIAVIEHIVPQCLDGWEGFTNLVACCEKMNLLLGGLPPKHKIEILLNWRGKSPCPMDLEVNQDQLEWETGKYIYMATCLDDPVYLRRRESKLARECSVEVPWGFEEIAKGQKSPSDE